MYLLLIYFLILVIPILVIVRWTYAGGISPYRTVLYGAVGATAGMVLVFMAASVNGPGLFAQINGLVGDMAEEMAKNPMIADSLGAGELSGEALAKRLEEVYSSVFALMPATLMILSLVVSYVEYIIISKIMSKKKQVAMLPKFREFSWPAGAFMGVIGMYLISWLLTMTGVFKDGMVYANMDMLFNFVFSIQGVSVVLMFCHMKRVPTAVGIVIAVLMWGVFIFRPVLMLLGMLDLIFGIKKRIRGRQ